MSVTSKSDEASVALSEIPESSNIIKIGELLESAYELKEFEWKIPDFFHLAEETSYSMYISPCFSIGNEMYSLKIIPLVMGTGGAVFCSKESGIDCSMKYNFSIKKTDGSQEQLTTISGLVYCPLYLVPSHLKIRQRTSELAPSNTLTIICTCKRRLTHPNQPTVIDKVRTLQLLRLDKLSKNFKDLLGEKETCDVVLKVQDKEYKAHKSILIARSDVFGSYFRHDTLEKQTGIISIEDCDPDSFQEFLEYLYSGKLEEITLRNALNLYYTSDKYGIEELKTFCVEYLMQCLTVENVCEIVVFAEKYDEKELFSAAQNFFNEHAKQVFETSEWASLLNQDSRLGNELLINMSKVKL